MRIKNESQRVFCFNGGSVGPGKVVDIQDEKVAEALIKGYPGEIFCLDNVEAEVIPAAEPAKEEAVEEEETVKVSTRKKKSKK
jgi:hypothetical protein